MRRERKGTNDAYYYECKRLIDEDLRMINYIKKQKLIFIPMDMMDDFGEAYWSGRNLINNSIDNHNVNGMRVYIPKWMRELEMKQWYRDKGERWMYRDSFRLTFGHRPIVEDWNSLKGAALEFIKDII